MSAATAPTETKPRKRSDLPGPRGLPVLGNAHQLLQSTQLHRTMERWAEAFGPIYRFDIGPVRTVVVVSDPDEIRRILLDRPGGFRRPRRQAAIFEELSPGVTGVFLAEGADWHRQRRLVIAGLNSNHLQRYFELIHRSGVRLAERLRAEAGEGDQAVDLRAALTAYTYDNTAALLFGQDANTLETGEGDLQHHFSAITTAALARSFAPLPYWKLVKLPADRAVERSVSVVDAILKDYVAKGRERLVARPELRDQPENLLDAMLAAQDAEGTFSADEISSNISTLLSAGQDTTAHTLGWTVWLLASRPDVQERLAEEARAALGDEVFPSSHATVDALAYADAVLREAIRLRPAAPALPVEPLADAVVCGTEIPAGGEIMLLLRAATREESPDADEFRPERWLGDGPAPAKTLAFGSGPRFCPGRNLALVEVKSVLAMLTRDFVIELDPQSRPVEEELRFAMAPSAFQVRLTPRSA